MVLTRRWWLTVGSLYLVVYMMIFMWMTRPDHAPMAVWLVPLTVAALCSWHYRRDVQIARWAGVPPLVILVITGLSGRWTWLF